MQSPPTTPSATANREVAYHYRILNVLVPIRETGHERLLVGAFLLEPLASGANWLLSGAPRLFAATGITCLA